MRTPTLHPIAAPTAVARRSAADPLTLALPIGARAITHGVFMVWVLASAPGWADVFRIGAGFGLVDGMLGLLTAWLLTKRTSMTAPPALVGVVVADGIMRLAVSVSIFAFPGIPDVPQLMVLFFGALGTWAAVGGAVALGGWLFAHRHHDESVRSHRRGQAVFDALSAAGLVALALAAYAVVMGPPANAAELRIGAAVACASLAVVFSAAAFCALRALPRSRT